jgi:diguanylate cyclase (GGDEF)-like protein
VELEFGSDSGDRNPMSPMQRLWQRVVGPDVASFFPFAIHRLILGVLLTAALTAQLLIAGGLLSPQAFDEQQLLGAEAEAQSVMAVQRESFNVVVELYNWEQGTARPRDVQIARALLAQRLSVITGGGQVTFEKTDPAYRSALTAIDEVIRALDDRPVDQRVAVLTENDDAVTMFLTQIRGLTETFEQVTRQQIERSLAERSQLQFWQVFVQITILLLLGLLSVSIVVAVGRGARAVFDRLHQQQSAVHAAEQRYMLIRNLDELLAPINRQIDANVPASEIHAAFAAALHGLSPDLRWQLPVLDRGEVYATAVDGAMTLDAGDLKVLSDRAQQTITALRNRDRILIAIEAERRNDALTGLLNRIGFVDAVTRRLEADGAETVTVVLVDVDQFSHMNSSLGFDSADLVLVDVARRLQAAVQVLPGATVARIAADEFGVVFVAAHDPADAARHIQSACSFISTAAGIEAPITVSIGYAQGQFPKVDAAELLRHVSVAILLAKREDRAGLVGYDPVRHAELSGALHDELAVRNALRAGEFVMHYQPIVDLATLTVVGCEALVRWQKPDGTLAPPGEFLPVIARSGFAVEFGLEVIQDVLRTWSEELRDAVADGTRPYVSVNVDAVQLTDSGFEAFLLAALKRNKVAPDELMLELTEHEAVNLTYAPMLQRLRDVGVRVAIDDFGTGFSSLSQSAQLPVDMLKLDRSFITSLDGDPRQQQMFADIARLSRTLGLTLVAEGIETDEIVTILRQAEVAYGQGFLFSKALPARDFRAWVKARRRHVGV